MGYNYAQHVAWDILTLTSKPMGPDMRDRVLEALKYSDADQADINTARLMVESLYNNWNADFEEVVERLHSKD